jgi:hypothetical protein
VKHDDVLPEHVRGLPLETQVAVLYERVGNLGEDVKGLKTIILGSIATVLIAVAGAVISVASGWVGPHAASTAARAIAGLFS